MDDIEELACKRNELKKKVTDWMSEMSAKGILQTNDQAPDWKAYIAAEEALEAVLAKI